MKDYNKGNDLTAFKMMSIFITIGLVCGWAINSCKNHDAIAYYAEIHADPTPLPESQRFMNVEAAKITCHEEILCHDLTTIDTATISTIVVQPYDSADNTIDPAHIVIQNDILTNEPYIEITDGKGHWMQMTVKGMKKGKGKPPNHIE
jgi:hypothetical protein